MKFKVGDKLRLRSEHHQPHIKLWWPALFSKQVFTVTHVNGIDTLHLLDTDGRWLSRWFEIHDLKCIKEFVQVKLP